MTRHDRRFDPRKVLDSDWRKRVWRRWLESNLAGTSGSSGEERPRRCDEPSSTDSTESVEERSTRRDESLPPAATHTVPPPATVRPPVRDADRIAEARRSELRARFDGLFDRLAAIEDTLEALGKRFSLKAVHERRQEQRLFERLDSSVEALERQALAIEATQAMVERIEQRVERIERRLRDASAPDGAEPRHSRSLSTIEQSRSSHGAPGDDFALSDLADLEAAFGDATSTSLRTTPPEALDPISGSSIHGNLSEMSLPTVLAMLELERRTGLLKVCADDGTILAATLRNGSIVGAKRQDLDADPIEVIGEAMRFVGGHFWFRQSTVEIASGPPRSVGSVLLEASSRNDEAARTG